MNNKIIEPEEFKKTQFDILISVDRFCKAHGIRYFLAYGTLIGALRHGGYIPWDDDIDISMPRPDYERFIKLYNKEKDKGYYVVSPSLDPSYPNAFAKICDPDTCIIEFSSLKYDIGVNIDLFHIDGLPEDEYEAKAHYSKINFYRNLLNAKKIKLDFKKRSVVKNIHLMLSKMALLPVSYKFLIKKINSLSIKYNYLNCRYAADLNFGNIDRRLAKKNFESCVPVEFEGHAFDAPAGYDLWLKSIYGNYMQLPPVEKQITHHAFKAYRK